MFISMRLSRQADMSPFVKTVLLLLCVATFLLAGLTRLQNQWTSSSTPTPSPKVSHAVTKSSKNNRPPRAAHSVSVETEAPASSIPPAEQERMHRMADNLLKPQLDLDAGSAAKVRGDWMTRFNKEKDPLLREEIITEMVQLDDALTVKTMVDLWHKEQHPGVREQIVLILGYMRSTIPEMATVSPAMMRAFHETTYPQERTRILEVMSNLPTRESVQFMQSTFTWAGASAEDRFNAAEGLFKLAHRVAVAPELIQQITERLRQDAQSAPTHEERLMAARALAAPSQNNKVFLSQLLVTETDPEIRKFLALASQEYPTH